MPSENVQKKFILTFDCKKCSLSFTKFGQFRTHTESHEDGIKDPTHEVESDDVIVKSVSEPFKARKSKLVKENKSFRKYSCEDCSERFDVHSDFRKPFCMKLQKKLLNQMPTHFSKYPGFVRIHSSFPCIRPRSVVRLGEDEFILGELKGEGGFAKVCGCIDLSFILSLFYFRFTQLLGAMALRAKLTQC